jgi:hypothetical protein
LQINLNKGDNCGKIAELFGATYLDDTSILKIDEFIKFVARNALNFLKNPTFSGM